LLLNGNQGKTSLSSSMKNLESAKYLQALNLFCHSALDGELRNLQGRDRKLKIWRARAFGQDCSHRAEPDKGSPLSLSLRLSLSEARAKCRQTYVQRASRELQKHSSSERASWSRAEPT
jgi:hypothetical protein